MKRLIKSDYSFPVRLSGADPVQFLDPGENRVNQAVWDAAREHPRVASQVQAGVLEDQGLWWNVWLDRFKAAVDAGETPPSLRELDLDELDMCISRTMAARYLRAMESMAKRGGAKAALRAALARLEG